jgi:hypothetical protein
MKGVCQTCGATAPLEWFLTTAQDRACMAVIARLPRDVAHQALHYLALFRPESGRSITPARAQKLLTELEALVSTGYVQVSGKVARPCPPTIWSQAMEQMMAKRDRLGQLKNHNYLRQVAWPLADAADAASERRVVEAERSHAPIREDGSDNDMDAEKIFEQYPQFRPTLGGAHADKS